VIHITESEGRILSGKTLDKGIGPIGSMVHRSLDRFIDQQVVRGISRCAWHLDMLLKDPRDRLLVRQTDQTLDFLAATKHQQRRNASDSK